MLINNITFQAQAKTFVDLQQTMETTRAHLQNQLRVKEGENNRFAIQNKKLEQESNVHSVEIEHYQGLIAATRDKSIKDKEALKKAARIQRERAQKQEEINEETQRQVSDLITELEHSKITLQDLTEAHVQLRQEQEDLEEDVKIFRKGILELGEIVQLSAKYMKGKPLNALEKLISKVRQLKTVKLENDNLKVCRLFIHSRLRSF